MKIKLLKDHPHGGSFYYRPAKAKADLYVLKEMGTYWSRIDIKKKDVWLDGGANIGAFSVRLAHQVKAVVAVEPLSGNSRLLARNLELNGCTNVTRLQGALVGNGSHPTKRVGKQKYIQFVLDPSPGGPGRGSLFRVRGKVVMVKAFNIEHIITKYKIDSIKFDIEGAEYQCLVALEKAGLLRHIRQVVMEFHFSMLKDKDRSMYAKVLQILKKNFKEIQGHTLKEAKELNLWTTLLYATK